MEGSANILVPIALFGCVVGFLALFAVLKNPRHALLYSFISAWLFLPNFTYEIEGLPDYSKLFATCFGILLAVFVFDFKRMLTIRPKWIDIPMIMWVLVPFGSSLTNGLGWWDGMSESLDQVVLWGIPYFLGRVYFTNWDELKDLASGFLIGGAVYTPFILYEMRFSPQLHRLVYGFHQHKFDQTSRFGMWRPMIFMQHGLMAAFWVMAIALIAVWLWRSGTFEKVEFSLFKRQFSFSFGFVALFFVGMTVLMVSVNAWVWMLTGLSVLFASQIFRTRWIITLLFCIVPMYAFLQGSNMWPTELSVDFMTGLIGEERAQSLEYRYFNEEYLTERAREQPIFGWAGWDRQHVDLGWGNRTVADSMWVTFFGKFGGFGFMTLVFSILLPAIVFVSRYRANMWSHPKLAPAAVFSVILVLYMLDGLLNNMINPLYMVTAGAMMGAYGNLPAVDSLTNETPKSKPPSQNDIEPPRGMVSAD